MKNKANKETSISATLYAWSNALGVDDETLRKHLTKAGHKFRPRESIPARAIFTAMRGEKDVAMTRKFVSEAKLNEQKHKINDGAFVDRQEQEMKLVDCLREGRAALVAFASKHGLKSEMEAIFASLRIEDKSGNVQKI